MDTVLQFLLRNLAVQLLLVGATSVLQIFYHLYYTVKSGAASDVSKSGINVTFMSSHCIQSVLPVDHLPLHALDVILLLGDPLPGDGVAGVGQKQRGHIRLVEGGEVTDGRLVRVDGREVGLDGEVVGLNQEHHEAVGAG